MSRQMTLEEIKALFDKGNKRFFVVGYIDGLKLFDREKLKNGSLKK